MNGRTEEYEGDSEPYRHIGRARPRGPYPGRGQEHGGERRALHAPPLFDWRNGGLVSNMTNNLWDEGGNSRDFVAKGDDFQAFANAVAVAISQNNPADVSAVNDLKLASGETVPIAWM